jgi:DnaJ-class molecular chaperone
MMMRKMDKDDLTKLFEDSPDPENLEPICNVSSYLKQPKFEEVSEECKSCRGKGCIRTPQVPCRECKGNKFITRRIDRHFNEGQQNYKTLLSKSNSESKDKGQDIMDSGLVHRR